MKGSTREGSSPSPRNIGRRSGGELPRGSARESNGSDSLPAPEDRVRRGSARRDRQRGYRTKSKISCPIRYVLDRAERRNLREDDFRFDLRQSMGGGCYVRGRGVTDHLPGNEISQHSRGGAVLRKAN